MTEPRVGILFPLRHRDFRLLAAGSLISLLGDGVFRVTIAVQVLAVNNDPRALSLVAACWASAQFVTLPAGGWAADRFARRTVMLSADVVRGLALGVLAALSLTDALQLWHLCALGALVGAGNGFFNPTAVSLVPDLLPGEDLERANAFLGVARPLMMWIVGPLLGAAVIAQGGPGLALGFDAVTFGVSAVFLLGIAPRAAAAGGADGAAARVPGQLAEGLRYVRQRPWAWAWIAAAGLSTLIHSGAFEVLLPTLLLNELGLDDAGVARALAGAFAAGGAGSVLVSTIIGQRGLPRRFATTLFACEAVALIAVAGYGLVTRTWQVAVLGFAIFTLFAVTDVVATTMFQRLVPRRLLGRVSSLDWMASVGLAPIGYLVAGPLAVAVGARQATVGLGLVGLVLVATMALLPGVRAKEQAGALRELRPDEDPPPPPVKDSSGLETRPLGTDVPADRNP
jgi:DHA3 family tetracycline resistance protein-like MFS transporter